MVFRSSHILAVGPAVPRSFALANANKISKDGVKDLSRRVASSLSETSIQDIQEIKKDTTIAEKYLGRVEFPKDNFYLATNSTFFS